MAPNDSTNPFNLPAYLPPTAASAATMKAVITSVQSAGKWQIFLVHGFTSDPAAFQPVGLTEFSDTVSYARSPGNIWIERVVDVAAYWRAQKLLAGTTPSTSDSDTTWTRSLPDNFPPGRYLRVTVTGGTLRQGATVLPWNGHGHYEVALDAGSLTLSP